MPFRSRTRIAAIVALIGTAAVGAALTVQLRRTAQPHSAATAALAPNANVLLITVDTLRADHLAAYGYRSLETPSFDRLAHEGVTFRSAYAAVPLTLPSHATLMTGLLPSTHGVRDNGAGSLEASRQTVATTLKGRGYRTAAFVSAFVLDRRWGLSTGFEEYFDGFQVGLADLSAMARVQRTGGVTWAAARGWIDAHANERFFVWMHLFDPHTPYAPPEPFRTRFRDRLYDGEIAYVDSILGEVLDELSRRSLLDKTVVMLASDHGEGLGEHREDEHGLLAYDSTLHVPWIVRLPDGAGAGTTVERAVGLVDVMPTILELTGTPVPSGLDGESVVALMRAPSRAGGDVLYAETLYPRLHFGWSELVSARDDRFKLIRGRRQELFDYRRDPGETVNVIDQHPDVASRLNQIASRVLARGSSAGGAATVDADTARRLNALGYFAGGAAPTTVGPQADPRDKTTAYRELNQARKLLDTDHDREGVDLLKRLLVTEPDLDQAHRTLREVWVDRGRLEEADRWFREQLGRRPQDIRLRVDLAFVQKAAEQNDAAIATLDEALKQEPEHVEALVLSGEVLRSSGRLEGAADRFERAIRIAPTDDSIRMQYAQTLFAMNRPGDSERVVRETLQHGRLVAGAHYLLAQIAEQRLDLQSAEREYRNEIAGSPWDYRARFNLALLIGQRGAHAEEIELLESIPPLAPQFGEVYFFLAKAILDAGEASRFPAAIDAAERGLRLAPKSPSAPLGHYVLGDIYRLQGRLTDSEREIARGRTLESQAGATNRARPNPRGQIQ
jgi:arylsulfatase A-like enzyme/thioredoxin-like negative regulator of GroEL